jgi:hypothetical protein
LPGNATHGPAPQAAPVEKGLPSPIGVEHFQSVGEPVSDKGDEAPLEVIPIPAAVIQADLGAGDVDQGMSSSASADVLAQFRGSPLF